MIAKIISTNKNSSSFGAVRYATEKQKKGEGELMKIKNFPDFFSMKDEPNNFKNYLKTISNQNSRIEKPQFHATISCEGKEYSKEQLTDVAEKWLDKMGYGKQPYLIVFHSDTNNNHVHVVTTRVDVETSKKINDSNERYKSLSSIKEVMKENYNVELKASIKDRILDYKYNSLGQAKAAFDKYHIPYKELDSTLEVKNSIGDKYSFDENSFNHEENTKRKKQIKALLFKYKDEADVRVFSTIDKKGNREWHSELQNTLHKKLGLEILFHTKDDKKPFGFSIIDHKSGEVFKGSDFIKMKTLFDFTDDQLDKSLFDILKNTNVTNETSKKAIADYYKIKEYMLFQKVKITKPDNRVFSWKSSKDVESWLKKNNLKLIKYQDNYHILDMKKNVIFDSQQIFKDRTEFTDFCDGNLKNEQSKKYSYDNDEAVISSNKMIKSALNVLGANESSGLDNPDRKRRNKKTKKR